MNTVIVAIILSVFGRPSFSIVTDSTKVDNHPMAVECMSNGTYKVTYPGIKPIILRLLDQPCKVLPDKQSKDFIEPINLIYVPDKDYAWEAPNNHNVTPRSPGHTWDKDHLLTQIQYDQVADQVEFMVTEMGYELQLSIYDDQDELIHHNNSVSGNVHQIFDFGEVETSWVNFVLSAEGQNISTRKFYLKIKKYS